MNTELPEYLTANEDGSTNIKLRRALSVSGAKVSVLTMREPTVEDHMLMLAVKGSDELQEFNFFANLCGITLADIKTVTLHDYKRLQRANSFMIA